MAVIPATTTPARAQRDNRAGDTYRCPHSLNLPHLRSRLQPSKKSSRPSRNAALRDFVNLFTSSSDFNERKATAPQSPYVLQSETLTIAHGPARLWSHLCGSAQRHHAHRHHGPRTGRGSWRAWDCGPAVHQPPAKPTARPSRMGRFCFPQIGRRSPLTSTPVLRIALPNKGRLAADARALFADAGLEVRASGDRALTASLGGEFAAIFVRAQDVPEFVADGAADAGVTGWDLVAESERTLDKLLDLEFGRCRLVVAARDDSGIFSSRTSAPDRTGRATCGNSIPETDPTVLRGRVVSRRGRPGIGRGRSRAAPRNRRHRRLSHLYGFDTQGQRACARSRPCWSRLHSSSRRHARGDGRAHRRAAERAGRAGRRARLRCCARAASAI